MENVIQSDKNLIGEIENQSKTQEQKVQENRKSYKIPKNILKFLEEQKSKEKVERKKYNLRSKKFTKMTLLSVFYQEYPSQ